VSAEDGHRRHAELHRWDLTTTTALGAGIGVVWAVFSDLPNEKVARHGYLGTAIGFAVGIFVVISALAAS
jgi:hypothetical protein